MTQYFSMWGNEREMGRREGKSKRRVREGEEERESGMFGTRGETKEAMNIPSVDASEQNGIAGMDKEEKAEDMKA
ncbi:hypothetical protein J8804_27745, partial [Klebsiella pneumoniae]